MLRRIRIVLSLCSILAGMACVNSAKADQFVFSYTDSFGDVISGGLTGTLQPDLDTVIVTAVTNPELNGVPGPDLPFIQSASDFYLSNPPGPALVTFSGINMDIIAATDSNANDGFVFLTNPIFGAAVFIAGPSYGSTLELYDSTKWSLRSVPEPSSLLLVGGGGFALAFGALRRNRRKQAATV